MKHFLILFFLSFAFIFVNGQNNKPVKVELIYKNNSWQLIRDGNPYFIKGAGGSSYIDRLKNYGGNSIRTWSLDNAQEVLDEAQKNGITVMLGLWVQCERHGFDYDDEVAVKHQLEAFTESVKKFKDHPALLLWGVGNEMDLQYTNPKVYDAVEDIIKMIHKLDPNHPAATVTAGFHQEVMNEILKRVPDLDIYGVNTYGDLPNTPEKIEKSGWKGPFIVSEFGPTGQWECPKTEWNQPIEETSKEKAKVYMERYQKGILNHLDKCLGSYVFLWGFKQETTSTWYGLFSKTGKESEVLDGMRYLWNGNWPVNRAPSLDSVFLDNKKPIQNIYLKYGEKYKAQVFASDPDHDKLKIEWSIYEESTDRKTGGDVEADPTKINGCIKKVSENEILINPPRKEGGYRLFVEVYDDFNHVAYANIPFSVKPLDSTSKQAEKIKLKNYNFDSLNENNDVLKWGK